MNLRTFLTNISTDAAQMQAYKANPSAFMLAQGLSQADHDLILNGDTPAIRARLAGDNSPAAMLIHITITIDI